MEYISNLKNFMTVADAANFLGVSTSTLRNWDKEGKLQAIRHPINNYRLYRKKDLQSLLEKIEQ